MASRERRQATDRPGRYPEVRVSPQEVARDHLSPMIEAAGKLADNCEHAEHAEGVRHSLAAVGQSLRQTAGRMAHQAGFGLGQLYLVRIWGVESTSQLRFVGPGRVELSGLEIMFGAKTWRQFQIGQIAHDQQFHPDVFGLSHYDQLRHYSFHITKLAWLLDMASSRDNLDKFYSTRLPDIALFGIKLATLVGQKLPDEPIDQSP